MRKEKLEELRSYIEELRTIKKEKIEIDNKSAFLGVEKYDCYLNNGCVIPRERLLKNSYDGGAVVVLPVTKEGKTLLVVQPRPNTKLTVGVELPAGYIEEGKNPVCAAKRELEEETGYVPEEMHFIKSYYQDQGCSGAYNYGYLATGCEKIKEQRLDKDEIIRYFECYYEEALELGEMGYIEDIQSQYILEKSKSYLLKKINR